MAFLEAGEDLFGPFASFTPLRQSTPPWQLSERITVALGSARLCQCVAFHSHDSRMYHLDFATTDISITLTCNGVLNVCFTLPSPNLLH